MGVEKKRPADTRSPNRLTLAWWMDKEEVKEEKLLVGHEIGDIFFFHFHGPGFHTQFETHEMNGFLKKCLIYTYYNKWFLESMSSSNGCGRCFPHWIKTSSQYKMRVPLWRARKATELNAPAKDAGKATSHTHSYSTRRPPWSMDVLFINFWIQ